MAERAFQFHPEDAIAEIADFIADPLAPADFPQHRLRWRNNKSAAEIGLAGLSDDAWIAHFGRFEPLAGSLTQPLALRYHGHQFRNYNPDIGDGRGFLFAQCRDDRGRLIDLGTKGSGQTPYSRFGDGRLTLKGGVREILATEMLEALGVPTSRSLSLIETGEALHRGDEPSPTRSAVLVRQNHGHIRIGSFQRLAALGLRDELHRLAVYSLKHYYREEPGADPAVQLVERVATTTANMAARFMSAGFVHGVLNSDNINISGESFDYGPWRFAPTYDPRFTAAYFDEQGLYAFGRQAEAVHWNVIQLANALADIGDHQGLAEAVNGFAPAYHAALAEAFCWRLGVAPQGAESDAALAQAIQKALSETRVPLDQFWFDWAGGGLRRANPAYDDAAFAAFRELVSAYCPSRPLTDAYWAGNTACSMLIERVEAIWSPIADRDDWHLFHDMVNEVRALGNAHRMQTFATP